jgi:hypothetical protein
VALIAGPEALRPPPERIAKPATPYRLASPHYWRTINLWVDRGEKIAVTFRVEPSGERADAVCGPMEEVCAWPPSGNLSDLATLLPDVKDIQLSGDPHSDLCAALKRLPHLQRIELPRGSVNAALLQALRSYPHLDTVSLHDARPTGEQMTALKNLPHLRTLQMDWSGGLPDWPAEIVPKLKYAMAPVALELSCQGAPLQDSELRELIAAGAALSNLLNLRGNRPADALEVANR